MASTQNRKGDTAAFWRARPKLLNVIGCQPRQRRCSAFICAVLFPAARGTLPSPPKGKLFHPGSETFLETFNNITVAENDQRREYARGIIVN